MELVIGQCKDNVHSWSRLCELTQTSIDVPINTLARLGVCHDVMTYEFVRSRAVCYVCILAVSRGEAHGIVSNAWIVKYVRDNLSEHRTGVWKWDHYEIGLAKCPGDIPPNDE